MIASTDFTVAGLTPGTLYVLTGWWSTEDLNSLTFTFGTNPCKDVDADGGHRLRRGLQRLRPQRSSPAPPRSATAATSNCNGSIDDAAACVRTCTSLAGAGGDVGSRPRCSTRPRRRSRGTASTTGSCGRTAATATRRSSSRTMSAAGTKIGGDALGEQTCGDCVNPRLVWAGTEYGAVWSQGRGDPVPPDRPRGSNDRHGTSAAHRSGRIGRRQSRTSFGRIRVRRRLATIRGTAYRFDSPGWTGWETG